MFGNNVLYLGVLSVNLACCVCYINYNMFEGFTKPTTHKKLIWQSKRYDNFFDESDYEDINSTVPTPPTSSTVSTTITSSAVPTRVGRRKINFKTANDYYPTTTEMEHKKPTVNVKEFNTNCPEYEQPLSLGTYEIPTKRDLVIFTQRTLLNMFNSYHQKTLLLLRDIKEATRATSAVEKKCHGRGKGLMYKQCVKEVNKKFVTITKGLVKTLERQEEEVKALTEGKICDMASMKTNPILLIKVLAMDEAALVFALPAFLRLLGACNVHCDKPAAPDHRPRLRQMSDQELVVKHFLTNKNYYQLLKDKMYV